MPLLAASSRQGQRQKRGLNSQHLRRSSTEGVVHMYECEDVLRRTMASSYSDIKKNRGSSSYRFNKPAEKFSFSHWTYVLINYNCKWPCLQILHTHPVGSKNART